MFRSVEVSAVLPPRNIPTLPARTSPAPEGETMSLANSALVRLAAATAGVLLLAVLVLSKLPKESVTCGCGSIWGGGVVACGQWLGSG